MACSRGVFYVSREELLAYEPGKSKPLTSSPFTPTDSSRTIECRGGVRPAMWTMQDGSIWCSTIRGLIVIDPKKINRVLPASPVMVEEVVVNGRNFSPDKIADLPVGNTNLEFRYGALSYVAPTRITFRYKLEGFDEDWIEAGGRREAFYTNLPPGTYQFRVMARKFTGDYEEAEPLPPFTILPHFYQRIWFLPLCAALVGLGGWGIYRLRVRRIKEQMRAVVSERSRIARELHDTLIQGFSGVTMQMQALSTRLPSTDERENLQEIIRDAGVCLRDARRSVAGLRHEPEGQSSLATAITQASRQLTETHDVRLNLRVQRDLPSLPLDVEYNFARSHCQRRQTRQPCVDRCFTHPPIARRSIDHPRRRQRIHGVWRQRRAARPLRSDWYAGTRYADRGGFQSRIRTRSRHASLRDDAGFAV
jgi:hypothetical protein